MAGSLDMSATWKRTIGVRGAGGRIASPNVATALDKAMVKWATTAVVELKEATPVEETGAMRRSWDWQHLSAQNAVEVRNPMKYSLFVIGGTGQSTGGFIYPIHGKFLRFMAKQGSHAGHMISRRRVRGQQPNPALNAIIDRLAGEAAVDLHQAGASIIKDLAGFEGGT